MKTKDGLRKAIESLPVETCPDNVWNKIESQLNGEDTLDRVLETLPVHACPDEIWPKVSQTLGHKSDSKLFSAWTVTSIAASVLLAMACIYFITKTHEQATLSFYEEEKIMLPLLEMTDSKTENDALLMIEMYCKKSSGLCNTTEYKAYHEEFTHLNIDIEKLNTQMKHDHEQVQLIQARIQLENAKSEVIKNMVKLVLQ